MAKALNRRRWLRGVSAAGVAAAAGMTSRPPAHPVVTTRHGAVRGFTEAGILVLRGIRYGSDTAPARFMPPRPWRDVQPALEYGSAAPQRSAGEPISEDCLFLNVWTPAIQPEARRPVMF